MDKLETIHHSLVDWAFSTGFNGGIATDQYVSAPSSLKRRLSASGQANGVVALGTALGANIPDGRLTTYYRFGYTSNSIISLMFKIQALNDYSLPANCYRASIDYTSWSIRRRIAAADTYMAFAAFSPNLAANAWHRFRIAWWHWLDAALTPQLSVTLERWVTGAFVQIGSFTEANPPNYGSTTNHIAILMPALTWDTWMWIDDTIVERKA